MTIQPVILSDKPKIVDIVVGVLALQGAFSEHIQLLRIAAKSIPRTNFTFIEVRTKAELAQCEALIIPGGESTTISLVAERSGLLEPLREFVKVQRKPVWGTCAGMILLAEQANRIKRGGQELIGGLDVRVDRNHFGRQVESFEKNISLPFLGPSASNFHAVFIRAPIVQNILPHKATSESESDVTVLAPSKAPKDAVAAAFTSPDEVQVLGQLDNPYANESSNVVAVKQGNVFGTSFHPELGTDSRIHEWWLNEVVDAVHRKEDLLADAMRTVAI